jgi:NADH-quinone oxidoreductase subunit G
MTKQVTLTIDGRTVTVPEGTMIVDAAKQVGIDIPVFCYHPKMEPVGMCRQCLVEIGRPVVDRTTGELVKEADGSTKIQFGPKLETSCTTPVSEGMVVLTESEKAKAGHREILEFLLTSHPLDCPVCDKGGECPLQNLTLGYGPGKSRFLYDEKMHLTKHLPLGELIFLDRERCIQCARCVRFQDEVVDEPVIGFYQRGRSIEIATFSEPGFDSYFSGNTSDICPVGALTTADFRFGARPWELKSAASICSQCPVGCNITFNTRREARSDGQVVVKRVMPRQNEQVNEIWVCDKGRFAYHYTESKDRLTKPLVRKDGKLARASWDSALKLAAEKLGAAKKNAVVLASGRLSNEDLFNLKELADGLGGEAVLYTQIGGGDLTTLVGVGNDSNFAELGEGDAILVVASDLQEEAPIWWLRIKQAAERGATLIVANPRQTKLDKHAAFKVHYAYGDEVKAVGDLGRGSNKVGQAFAKAQNAIVLFGSEGLGLEGSSALAAACAGLLQETGHVGKPNNGLIGVWQRANDQGAWELDFRPQPDLASFLKGKTVYVVAADPAGDDPALAKALKSAESVIVQELFRTTTADLAEVVLPAQAYTEREGTYTSGERRVQRFYPAVPARDGAHPDFAITAEIGNLLDIELEARSPRLVFERLAVQVKGFEGISYGKLAKVSPQWPIIGRGDLYYGGTSYANTQGLGVQLTSTSQRGEAFKLPELKSAKSPRPKEGELLGVPVTRLYDHGVTVDTSELLHQRVGELTVGLHPSAAEGLATGQRLKVSLNGATAEAILKIDESIPAGVALLPRSMGFPITAPAAVSLTGIKKAAA